jgi:hypothetical protein
LSAEKAREGQLITVPELASEALGTFLAEHMSRRFSATQPRLAQLVPSIARLAIDCIGNSNALYHNVEHTLLVTVVGYDIMKGKALLRSTDASEFAHVIVACLLHDIGYVRGILEGDSDDGYVIDAKGNKTSLPRGSSDAALLFHHVDRSKLFALDRIAKMEMLDADRIARAIEFTRFPASPEQDDKDNEEGLLVRAADLIGQLGDPHYLQKANALYFEFEEAGLNRQLGYTSPADLTELYPQFYWNNVSAHIQTAIRYLNVTSSGRQWIASLYSNVFRAERDVRRPQQEGEENCRRGVDPSEPDV